MTEIETRTSWTDSGYDCDHCGGRILKRTDYETGEPDRTCLQCEQCGCQWTLSRETLRVGHRKECRAAQRLRQSQQTPARPYDQWLLVVVAAVTLFLLLRFGGAGLLRFLLPIALLGITLFVLVRIGREREWW